MNLATLNVATLIDKELFLSGLGVHVLGVQETVVPPLGGLHSPNSSSGKITECSPV